MTPVNVNNGLALGKVGTFGSVWITRFLKNWLLETIYIKEEFPECYKVTTSVYSNPPAVYEKTTINYGTETGWGV